MAGFRSDAAHLSTMRKKRKKGEIDNLEKGIKRLEVAAQTPFEKSRRRKRIQQSREHKVS